MRQYLLLVLNNVVGLKEIHSYEVVAVDGFCCRAKVTLYRLVNVALGVEKYHAISNDTVVESIGELAVNNHVDFDCHASYRNTFTGGLQHPCTLLWAWEYEGCGRHVVVAVNRHIKVPKLFAGASCAYGRLINVVRGGANCKRSFKNFSDLLLGVNNRFGYLAHLPPGHAAVGATLKETTSATVHDVVRWVVSDSLTGNRIVAVGKISYVRVSEAPRGIE